MIKILSNTFRKPFKKPLSKTIPQVINLLIGLLLITAYAVVSFWLLYPYEPITIKGPLKVINENKIVHLGENLIYEMDFEKHMPLAVTVHKQLIDGVVITYAPIVGNVPVGKSKHSYLLPVSKYADPGQYRLKWEGHYRVNPLRTITVIVWSEYFEVIE